MNWQVVDRIHQMMNVKINKKSLEDIIQGEDPSDTASSTIEVILFILFYSILFHFISFLLSKFVSRENRYRPSFVLVTRSAHPSAQTSWRSITCLN